MHEETLAKRIYGLEAAAFYVRKFNTKAWENSDPRDWCLTHAVRMLKDRSIRAFSTGGLCISWDDEDMQEFRVLVDPNLFFAAQEHV